MRNSIFVRRAARRGAGILLLLALLLAACGGQAAPEPVEVVREIEVTREVEVVQEVEVEVTREVEVVVEVPAEEEAPAESAPLEITDITDAPIFYGDTWTWPFQTELLAHMTRGKFYVNVQDDNVIAVIDPDAPDYGLHFITTAFVQPHHPWMAPGMRYNWINFQSEGKGDHDAIAIVDTWTDKVIKYIQTGTNDPFHMAFSPTQNVLVTGDLDGKAGRVHLFDTVAMEEIAQVATTGIQTRDITISHDGRYAFIGHQGYKPDEGVMGGLDVLDIASQEIVATFGEGRCRSGKMNNAGTLVLYSCDKVDRIIVIDVQNLELVKEIEAPEGSAPFNISFRPDDRYAYVGLAKAGQLGVIDMETLEIVKTLDSGTDTNSTYIHPYAPLAVTTNDGTDTHVSILDIENNEIIDTIETGGKGTHNGQWSPDGRWFIVSNRLGDSVTLLTYNPDSGAIEWVDDVVVGFGANGVHWTPYFCGVPYLTADNVATAQNLPAVDADGTCGEFEDTAAAGN